MNYVNLLQEIFAEWWLKIVTHLPNILVGLLVFTLFFSFSRLINNAIISVFNKISPKNRQPERATIIANIAKFLVVLIGTFVTLEILQLGGLLLKLLGSLGVAGIIAGVALKDLVSSAFSGMLVGIDKAFKEGDYVTISNTTGTVEEIGFLTTKIITDEGKKVYIPNQLIFSAPFINFSASQQRKVFIELEIPNFENLEKTKQVLMDEITNLETADRLNETEVVFIKQSLGIIYLEVRFWMKAGSKIALVKSEALLRIKQRFDKEGIRLATPTTVAADMASPPKN